MWSIVLHMTETSVQLNPLSRNPDLQFRDIEVTTTSATFLGAAEILGTVKAIAELPGWAPTSMHFRIVRAGTHILLGQRCGLLHIPHLNARHQASAETLWCTNCWVDSTAAEKGSLIVPFYLYYRHYEDHVIEHLPPCPGCARRFQVWDAEEPLRPSHTHLFSAYMHPGLLAEVKEHLSSAASVAS